MDTDQKDISIDGADEPVREYYEPTDADKALVKFVIDHTDRWREWRKQNYDEEYDRYERIFRGKWAEEDKGRQSERSRVISPATQQAVETRHAEIMEAIFGQGEFFDIEDDIEDKTGPIDVEAMKKKLYEDFAQDKIRKSIDQIELLAEIYGTGIGEIVVGTAKQYRPMTVPINQKEVAYGVGEKDRVTVKLHPVNPKNFLFDPNGTSIDDCMGVAIERYTSIHKVAAMIADGTYLDVDISSLYKDDSLESTQEKTDFQDEKVISLVYYGLVPRETMSAMEDDVETFGDDEIEKYSDMVEAIVVIGNGGILLKAEPSPYMMQDRPVISYQDDTVPNRLLGRGTVEKAFNMQCAIDGSMRSHMDSLALTSAPMMGMDATRLPRGAKFQIKPGANFLTNGNPNEIMFPFNFGTTDGAAMTTSKEFERMLLMATGTVDSQGQVSQVARDSSGLDLATATIIKKYKRTLVNFQEDFLIPFIYKAAWRRMQFDPERYPSVDVKFIPTATLGIIAREYEQKQMAFLIQTLGADSPIAPVLMQGILKNSSLSDRESMIAQLTELSKPDPEQQKIAQERAMREIALLDAQIASEQAKAKEQEAQAQKATVEAQIAPEIARAKLIAALSNNLDEDNEGKDFERRAKIAELMLKEKEINVKEEDSMFNRQQVFAQMAANGGGMAS